MKFNEEKKHSIILYLLEKIRQGDEEISKTVSEVFSVNQNTIHTYINELLKKNIIKRVRRGKYELIKQTYRYQLKRSAGDLDTDTYAYVHCLQPHINSLPENVQRIWIYSFSEMINNIMDHSLAENASVVIEQDFLSTGVFLADDGVGIFEKIKEHFKFPTLDDAVCELFKGKLTTDSEKHSGEGIFFTSKMMDYFLIVSGEKVFTNNKYDNSRIMDIASKSSKGTCVIMRLSNFTHKKPQEVFDLYADVNGGFTKTKIPMKNIFDSAPVSRSQAKRVCNRLEEFQEVVIDFDGLPWMGQGFAHQMFVVFAKEHPDIQLICINMNEDVAKMYHHVTVS